MSHRFSLRARLMLAYTGLIVIGFAGLALLAGRQIATSATEDYGRELIAQAGLVARALAEPLEHAYEGETSEATVAGLLDNFARQVDAGIILFDNRGRLLLASDDQLLSGEPRGGGPEIAVAFDGRASLDTRPGPDGEVWLYAAAPIVEDDDFLGVVRLQKPGTATRSLVLQRWLALGGGVLALALLALLGSSWLAASLTRPLAQLRSSALELAEGNLSLRLPADRGDEIGELAASFNHMAERVEAMVDEQRAFASNASHELRTPLTAIRLRSEALRAGNVDAATATEYIAEIDDEAQRLSQLVEDLLLLSRFDSGRLDHGEQRVDPARLARHLLQSLSARADAQGVTLKLEAPTALPPVTASLSHLHVVFRNLLDNALKHTPPGGHVIWSLDVVDGILHAIIADDGQGIGAEDLPHLFKRFYRADKARNRGTGGVGLGLSLVDAVVHSYGGVVTISSAGLGQGTTVEVRWPLDSRATPAGAA
ncbi:MAG: ATP-binding protein [Anaerolineae bacterium]|nr:ATP-binding protein [Anaerolineae bacterium]